jgi:hypothetical protein
MTNRTTRWFIVPAMLSTVLAAGCWSTRAKTPSYTPAMGTMASQIPLTPVAQNARPGPAPVETWWTCPMHANVAVERSGKCPICGMDLVRASDAGSAHDSHSGHSHSQSSGARRSSSSGGGCCG